jgi:DNA-binding NarL/FixJ family response regulator
LVLEDDDLMREELIDMLSMGDYLVDGACEPAHAVDLAKRHAYDLMVSDIRMAGPTDGLGTVAHIKEKLQRNILVVMITGFADEAAPRRALDIAVDAYLYKKNLTIQGTLALVESLLKQKTQRSFLEQLLEPLWARPLKFLQAQQEKQKQAEREALLKAKEALDQAKLDAYKRLVVAVMSGNILRSASLEIWDLLVEIDESNLKAGNLAEMGQAHQSYLRLRDEISRREARNELNLGARPPGKVSKAEWKILFDKIQAGLLNATQLQFAEKLRTLDLSKEPKYEAMYRAIWQ